MRGSEAKSDSLDVFSVKGSAGECGLRYGSHFLTLIQGFFAQEIRPDEKKRKYAQKCLPFIRKYAPASLEFLKGMSKGAGISLCDATLLSLHEEIYHRRVASPHCTAIVASAKRTRDHKNIVAQNWDWQPFLFPWPGLVRLQIKRSPRVLAYHYPGLWNCCGINSEGLSLMWTGGGYFPPVLPKVGVPTYVIISELLRKRNVAEALSALLKIPRAGAFIMLLADRSGNTAVIEATPDKIEVQRAEKIMFRANLYMTEKVCRASKQASPNPKKQHSLIRTAAIARYIKRKPLLSVSSVKEILADKHVFVDMKYRSVTIDQLLAICDETTLLVRRGGAVAGRHPWRRYKV